MFKQQILLKSSVPSTPRVKYLSCISQSILLDLIIDAELIHSHWAIIHFLSFFSLCRSQLRPCQISNSSVSQLCCPELCRYLMQSHTQRNVPPHQAHPDDYKLLQSSFLTFALCLWYLTVHISYQSRTSLQLHERVIIRPISQINKPRYRDYLTNE